MRQPDHWTHIHQWIERDKYVRLHIIAKATYQAVKHVRTRDDIA